MFVLPSVWLLSGIVRPKFHSTLNIVPPLEHIWFPSLADFPIKTAGFSMAHQNSIVGFSTQKQPKIRNESHETGGISWDFYRFSSFSPKKTVPGGSRWSPRGPAAQRRAGRLGAPGGGLGPRSSGGSARGRQGAGRSAGGGAAPGDEMLAMGSAFIKYMVVLYGMVYIYIYIKLLIVNINLKNMW